MKEVPKEDAIPQGDDVDTVIDVHGGWHILGQFLALFI
jgi:hypothetical protein